MFNLGLVWPHHRDSTFLSTKPNTCASWGFSLPSWCDSAPLLWFSSWLQTVSSQPVPASPEQRTPEEFPWSLLLSLALCLASSSHLALPKSSTLINSGLLPGPVWVTLPCSAAWKLTPGSQLRLVDLTSPLPSLQDFCPELPAIQCLEPLFYTFCPLFQLFKMGG